MNVMMEEMPAGMAALKARLKETWMAGDYDGFSRYMEKGTEEFYERLGIPGGARVLDVACGAGQVALLAARAGARAVGCDIATNWIERARMRANAEGLPVLFDEGDAEMLPYGDGEFDAVVSMVGAMFAPRPERVAAEMLRVCRPGGMIAMANWTGEGFIGQMLRTIGRHIAPPGMPSPLLWGDMGVVRERLGEGLGRLEMTPRVFRFEYPFPPARVVEFFRVNYGPMSRAFAGLDVVRQEALREELVALWAGSNRAMGNWTMVEAVYLAVVGMRREE